MIKRILISVSLLVAAPVMAAIDTWNFENDTRAFIGSGNGNTLTVDNNEGNTNAALDKISITGWSDTGTGNTLETGTVGYSSGYGATLYEQSSPNEHSIDNIGGNFDMVLVSFEESMNLSRFGIGWRKEYRLRSDGSVRYTSTRADVSVVAYTGTNDITTLSGTWQNIVDGDWTAVGSYNNVDSNNAIAYQTVTTDISSKYWLIGAYNPTFLNEATWDTRPEGFKLASVAGTYADTPPPPSIPEPTSLFLFATALFGLASTQRGKAKI